MKRIDMFPTNSAGDLKYRIGRVFPFGATIMEDGVNFSIFSKQATGCTLLLFHHGEREPYIEIPFPDEFRIGNVYSMMVFGITLEDTEYGYRFYGRNDPSAGLLFDSSRVVLDPYAKSVSGRTFWGERPDPNEPFAYRGQIIREDYEWNGDKPLEIPMSDLVIYEMHVRSFTKGQGSGARYPGTFYGIIEKIPYLKELGVNCIELMPIFEFDEFSNSREYNGRQLYNYWGYSTVCFFAPKAGYSKAARLGLEADELKNLIKTLHKNGIEVILDVVFNHTAEGNENGPVISYKGIDNRTYYLLTPDGGYYNFSGCGNTMNCNNAVVRNHILDCLRYWVSAYHIDGFRFDLASILTRDMNGAPMLSPPLLETMAHDAVLGSTKLIAEAWDAGGLYQVGSFPSWNRWSEWNGRYRDCVRRFIKGGAECAPELYERISGSGDMYGGRTPAVSVNFVTCHDGFTMYDLVSYNCKHNELNGEDGRDGCNDNDSWNCGTEGDTDDRQILDLRFRQIRNMYTLLLTSRGVPMLLSGDEFANSQQGNNNAYCQDNDISYLDWRLLDKNRELFEYVRQLIRFRREHPVLRWADYELGHNGTGYPELSFHSLTPWQCDRSHPSLTVAYLFAEDHQRCGTERDCFIYVMVNAHWESHSFQLPIIPAQTEWHLFCRSSGELYPVGKERFIGDVGCFELGPRETAILIAKQVR